MSLPLHTFATLQGFGPHARLLKALSLREALKSSFPPPSVAVDLRDPGLGDVDPAALAGAGYGAVVGMPGHGAASAAAGLPLVHSLRRDDVVAPGDVVRVEPKGSRISVLYRRGANSNSLFVTERCNSLCLMCSQPPRPDDDGWRLDELIDLVGLIDPDLSMLGVTGGEPTLLGRGLTRLLEATRAKLPSTRLHILSNGRLFHDAQLVERMAAAVGRATWAIPLYADIARVHDHVVQAPEAFEETLEGIHNLAEHGHAIEVRFVAHALTVPRLQGLAEFIWRNLPFVEHVALMGLEPMGFTRRNRDVLWIDPAEAGKAVANAAEYLARRGMTVSIYNTPLCLLPKVAWPLARRSISDWKQDYAPECEPCSMRDGCSGFFSSADLSWRGKDIRPIRDHEVMTV
ncbi:His-Xaa-Ser system radical SAM maturase HxsC [Muricoccus aerilatus]|uniref:His-Xaa-Ser system radical SAM maturase HxsC n=1 Tax=Muricoccus aerilatus TaxID=452982 RepID=UPI0005C15746|nr:His-Xaa-Ser system radical SAM maturase HxsC [Roseomonas aerilata]